MANLIIDIGNTSLKAAWADGITLGKTFRYQGEKTVEFIFSLVEKNRPETIVLSSVRNFNAHTISGLEKVCDRLIIMDDGVKEKFHIPAFLAPDRAASIIAARHLFKCRSCTIFDLGTLLTIDNIDEEGNFTGGVISPGCMTRFKSINRYSKHLPLLDMPDEIEENPLSVASSITSGVISGIIFEIEEYISRNPKNIKVFTGGDAIYFAKRMKNSIFVVSNLVLIGLALTAIEYDKNC